MATYYVATTGNDTTGDGSEGNPWATLAKAIATMSAAGGHVVNMAAGTYNENNGAGYLIWNANYSSEVRIVGAGVGETIIRGTGSTYTFRVNTTLANVTFEELTIRPLGSRSAFSILGTGTSSNIKFKNAKLEAAGGTLASTRGMVELAAAATLNGLTFDNCEIDTDAATSGNALMLNGTLNGLTVTNGSDFHGVGATSFIRIDEASGSHTWGGDCSVSVSNASMAIWYQATATADLVLEFESGFSSTSSGDDAAIIVGGTSGNNVPSVTVGNCTFNGGNGGLRIDAYVDVVTITGGTYTSGSTSPGLSVQSDGISGAIGSATVTGAVATSDNGHGGSFGIELAELMLNKSCFDGSDHSLVLKAQSGLVENNIAESGSGSGCLSKGADGLTIRHNIFKNNQSGGFCLDIRDQDASPSDNLNVYGNTLQATGAAKALNVSSGGVGNAVIEHRNYVTHNATAEILGTSCEDLTDWNDAYSAYAITTNGLEYSDLPEEQISTGLRIGL